VTKQREKDLAKKTKSELIDIIKGYETKKEDTNIPLNLTLSIVDSEELYNNRIESDTIPKGMPTLRGER
jgi:hypothetical protein